MCFSEFHERLVKHMQGVFYPNILAHTKDVLDAKDIDLDIHHVYGDYVCFDREAYPGDEERYTVFLVLWSEDEQVSPNMETRYEVICTSATDGRVFDEGVFDTDAGIVFQSDDREPQAPFEITEEHVAKGIAAIDQIYELIQEDVESAKLDFEERYDRHPYW